MAVTTSQITITTMEGWYSGDTAPSNPLIGDLWLDTTTNEIKKWDGTNWVKQADTQGPQGPKGDSMVSREAYWIKSSTRPEPPDSETGNMKGWTKGSEPPESALAGILPSDKFWRIYKETYSNGESEYIKYSEVELIGSYEVLNGLVQFRNGVSTTENKEGQNITVIDGGKILTGSIEADKMSIKDLSALKAKIGGFNVGENSIYSGTKSSINNTEKGIYFDSNGQSYFGDNKNFIRFYQSAEDGKYKLQVSADSLTFGSSESVEKAIDNLEIGGRNLLPDTDFEDTSKKYIVPDGVVEGYGGEGGFQFTPTTQIESGIEYTLSLRMRGVANVNFYELYTSSNISHRIAKRSDLSETDYKKISFTFVVRADRTFQKVYICTAWGQSATGDWFEIEPKSLKLEKGNKATDWTPAPEDIDAGITNAQTTADTAKTNAATAQTTADTAKANAATAQTTADTAKANAATAQTAANKAQTTADEALKDSKENAAQMAQMVTDFNGDIKNLQDQIDGNITTWFYDNDPAINLPPVTDWDTDKKKDAHLGDIYYNTVKGYAWRFMKSGSTYSWERITDIDITKALADAAKAQDTADSKRRVFYNTPTVPYDAGDLWVQGSDGDILRCAQAKKSTGSYNRNDWILASKYTDDSALTTWIKGDFATTIQGLEEGLVDAKIETYYQTTDPSTEWPTDKKMEHKGDLWYNSTTSVQKYYRWSGTTWQELTATPPKEVFDSIDNKATIYTGATLPSSPSKGDLWFKGANNPILTYVGNTWVEYNKYTDNTRAEEAYDKAGEAAKTADNYISADSTGIMVSKNTGATKETPSNATKNNVLITDTDVQIRNGKKTVASYGNTTIIGTEDGNHFVISPDAIKAKTRDIEILKIIFEAGVTSKTATTAFHGEDVAKEILNGNTYIVNLRLGEKATEITEVLLYNSYASTEDPDMVIDNTKSWINYEYNNTLAEVNLTIEGSYDDAKAISWNKYIALKVRYTPLKKYDSTVTCDNLTASGKLTVKRELTATNAIIDGSLNVSDITLFDRKGGSIAYYDQSGSWADLIRIRKGAGTATATTGRVSIQPNWWRCGNLVQMEFGVAATGAVNPGKNLATGTIKGIPRPVTTYGLRAVSYYGNNANVLFVSSDGGFTVRNCGSDALAKGNDAIGIFTYITDGTML